MAMKLRTNEEALLHSLEAQRPEVEARYVSMNIPRIYVAGPFRADSAWGIEQNIRRAEVLGLEIVKMGGCPIIPHTMYRFFQGALPDEVWLDCGLALLEPCHAIVCARGWIDSTGTRGELARARALQMPAFFQGEVDGIIRTGDSWDLLSDFITDWRREHNQNEPT